MMPSELERSKFSGSDLLVHWPWQHPWRRLVQRRARATRLTVHTRHTAANAAKPSPTDAHEDRTPGPGSWTRLATTIETWWSAILVALVLGLRLGDLQIATRRVFVADGKGGTIDWCRCQAGSTTR
jgi:hypothetical protein